MKILVGALLAALSLPLAAQPEHQGWEVEGAFDLFTTDDLGNLYVLGGDELSLYNRQGTLVARNSFNSFGPITAISAYSSLKPVIFSHRQAQLAMLDNTLSIQGQPIDLSRSGHTEVRLACAGVQNAFWLFDERTLSITRMGRNLQPLAESGRLDQLLGFSPRPTQLTERENRLYLVDPDHGVLVFDLFASFLRTLPIYGVERIQVDGQSIWYVTEGALKRYDLRTFDQEAVAWPASVHNTEAIQQARVEQGRLYLSTTKGIRVEAIGL